MFFTDLEQFVTSVKEGSRPLEGGLSLKVRNIWGIERMIWEEGLRIL